MYDGAFRVGCAIVIYESDVLIVVEPHFAKRGGGASCRREETAIRPARDLRARNPHAKVFVAFEDAWNRYFSVNEESGLSSFVAVNRKTGATTVIMEDPAPEGGRE